MKNTYFRKFISSPFLLSLLLVIAGSYFIMPPFVGLSLYTQILLLFLTAIFLSFCFDEKLSQKYILKFSGYFGLFVILKIFLFLGIGGAKGNPFVWVPIALNFNKFMIACVLRFAIAFGSSYFILTIVNYVLCALLGKLENNNPDNY